MQVDMKGLRRQDLAGRTGLEGSPTQSGCQRWHEKLWCTHSQCGTHQPGLWGQADPHEFWNKLKRLDEPSTQDGKQNRP